MFLVDTNVISAAAPARRAARLDVVAWMDRNAALLFVSVVTIAEIEDWIAKARRTGATRKADDLGWWLETLLHLYGDRVLPVDVPAARFAGVLADLARGAVFDVGFSDLAIAATAHIHGLTVLTRNIRHFGQLPVPVCDPFARLPAV
jgi:predicted nucleic acid-binding protein